MIIKFTNMELEGKVIAVLESRGGISKASGNPWKVQEYVIETIEQYPHRMAFSIFGEDKINEFAIKMGETIKVSFDINCREYNGRWYNDIRAWKVERPSADQQTAGAAPQPAGAVAPQEAPTFDPSDSTDDLPF